MERHEAIKGMESYLQLTDAGRIYDLPLLCSYLVSTDTVQVIKYRRRQRWRSDHL